VKFRLPTGTRKFVPDVELESDSTGEVMNNRDLPIGERVECEITLASESQKAKYTIGYSEVDKTTKATKSYSELKYEVCVKKHCTSITGLEENGIKTGADLVKYGANPVINEIIAQIFAVVIGIEDIDADASEPGEDLSKE